MADYVNPDHSVTNTTSMMNSSSRTLMAIFSTTHADLSLVVQTSCTSHKILSDARRKRKN